MRKMFRVTCCILALAAPLFSQAQRGEPVIQPSAGPPYQHPAVVTRPYQQTWYDGLLRQFNPDNLDWGQWLEQRRQAFIEQTAYNPYFKYSLLTTILLMLVSFALAKSEIDKSRILRLAQERHEALLAQDKRTRRIAHQAIRRHNTHMEKCNRVVEREAAAQRVVSVAAAAADAEGRSEEALAEAANLRRERDVLASKVEEHNATVGQLAARLNSVAVGVPETKDGVSSQTGPSQGDFVKQINDLQERLYRERERNKRLKGM
jgi:hypothetical protein